MGSDITEEEAGWLAEAEFCKRMAERAATAELRAHWLSLADKWLSLLDAKIGKRRR